jgi:hypothetical protein
MMAVMKPIVTKFIESKQEDKNCAGYGDCLATDFEAVDFPVPIDGPQEKNDFERHSPTDWNGCE